VNLVKFIWLGEDELILSELTTVLEDEPRVAYEVPKGTKSLYLITDEVPDTVRSL
jgi:hypothetical protein